MESAAIIACECLPAPGVAVGFSGIDVRRSLGLQTLATAILRLHRSDPRDCACREQQFDVGLALRDIDAVAADTLDDSNDDMLMAVEVPQNRPPRISRRGLNRGLDESCRRTDRSNPDHLALRSPQILEFESVAAAGPMVRRIPGG